jgi:hypothetical protein
MPRTRLALTATTFCFLSFALMAPACSSDPSQTPSGSTGSTAAGGFGGAGGGSGGEGATGGGSATCFHATTLIDVSKAPGAGGNYAKPTLSGVCTATHFVVDSNGMPHYTFVPITPNPLVEGNTHWEITLDPQMAATTTDLPLLGPVAFAVNGLPIFGPNEGAQPAAEAYGDPIFNGIMDPCLGHTAERYHYHSLLEKCLTASGLVSEPWTNPEPDATKASPVLGWALDGFPVYGSRECSDANCSSVVTIKSGYTQTGNPKTNAWQAYTWSDHPGDNTFLDECNGHTGPDGKYHYHVTEQFPYVMGCYRGTPNGGGMQMPGDGGMMMGPKSCTSPADCALTDCPPGSKGCTCGQSPMGQICVPTCTTNTDCPMGPMGMQLSCKNGVCAP